LLSVTARDRDVEDLKTEYNEGKGEKVTKKIKKESIG
jgi:hypothetical protein